MENPLDLIAAFEAAEFPPGRPVLVEVRLLNRSDAELWVNARLGVGYRDALIREIYFEIFEASGDLVSCPEQLRRDVHRMPPKAEDFRRLAPGEGVSASFDVAEWCPLPRPGRYRVELVYENTWNGSEYGVSAFTGVVRARPIDLVLR